MPGTTSHQCLGGPQGSLRCIPGGRSRETLSATVPSIEGREARGTLWLLLMVGALALGIGAWGRLIDREPGLGAYAATFSPVTSVEVRPGQTLWSIARQLVGKEGDPRPVVETIRRLNELRPDRPLQPGQRLWVPVVEQAAAARPVPLR